MSQLGRSGKKANPTTKKILFNPLLATKDDVLNFLRTAEAGTAHPFNRVLLVWDGQDVAEIDLADKPASFFLDATNLNLLGTVLLDRMRTHLRHLGQEESYTVVTPTEASVDLPLVSGNIICFALSLSNAPTFYDLAIGNSDGDILCYNSQTSRELDGLLHSGDISSGPVLLHSIKMEDHLTRQPFVIAVSGYTNHALHRYDRQNPAVLLVNHESKCLYLVPIPLDRATIGEATLCCSVVGRRRDRDHIRFTFLPNPPTCTGIYASSSKLAQARGSLNLAVQMADSIQNEIQSSSQPEHEKPENKMDVPTTGDVQRQQRYDLPEFGTLAIVEKGLDIPACISAAHVIQFGAGLEILNQTNQISLETDDVVFPCCLGNTLEGPKILALGKPYRGVPEPRIHLPMLFQQASIVVLNVSDTMSDQLRTLNPHERVNAIVILQTKAQYDANILDKRKPREEFFNNLNINAVTALAGPQSIVIVRLLDNYFFYRGIRWPGVLDFLPSFGDDVTDFIHAIGASARQPKLLPWPNLTSLRDNAVVYFEGNKLPVIRIKEIFASMSLHAIEERRVDITDILTQLQSLLAVEEIQPLARNLTEVLRTKISNAIGPARQAYVDFMVKSFTVSTRNSDEIKKMEIEKNSLHATYRGLEREALSACQWLINGLGDLVSARTSSTKNHDLNQLRRRNKVMENVSNAKNMTAADLSEILNEKCKQVGVIMGNIEESTFIEMATAVAQGQFLAAANRPPLNTKLVCSASTLRSSDEVMTLLPLVSAMHKGPLSRGGKSGEGEICWAFPQVSSSGEDLHSAIPWPCFDQFVELKDPSKAYWPEVSQEGHIAKLRIVTRGTIAAASCTKRLNITPANHDLGFLLAVTLIHLMQDFTQTRANIVSPKDFSDPYCQVMRGLFGQLLTILASGSGKPLSMAWQMTMQNPKLQVPPDDEWFIYSSLCSLIVHTGWPMETVAKNIKFLIVRTFRERITDPVTEPMRKAVTDMMKAEQAKYLKHRNAQLEFLQTAVEVVRHIQGLEAKTSEEVQSEVKAIAKRMLESHPETSASTNGFNIVLDYLKCLAKKGTATEAQHTRVLNACLNMYVKRSGRYKKAKNAVHKRGKKGDDEAAVDVVDKMESDQQKLSALWGSNPVRVQNWQAYEAIKEQGSVSEELLVKVSGDAERTRIPWRVLTGEEAPSEQVEKTLSYILGKAPPQKPEDVASQSNKVATRADVKASDMVESLDKRLARLQKSNNAVALALKVNKLEIADLCELARIPAPHFAVLLGVLGGDVDIDKLRRVVTELLEGWRDHILAELNCMNIF